MFYLYGNTFMSLASKKKKGGGGEEEFLCHEHNATKLNLCDIARTGLLHIIILHTFTCIYLSAMRMQSSSHRAQKHQ